MAKIMELKGAICGNHWYASVFILKMAKNGKIVELKVAICGNHWYASVFYPYKIAKNGKNCRTKSGHLWQSLIYKCFLSLKLPQKS